VSAATTGGKLTALAGLHSEAVHELAREREAAFVHARAHVG
jgi:hypothetical protein